MNTNTQISSAASTTLSAVERAKARLQVLKEEAAARVAIQSAALAAKLSASVVIPHMDKLGWTLDNSRPWNPNQMNAISSALAGRSFCLIGAAGTGKTSTLKGAVNSLMLNSMLPIVQANDSSKMVIAGKPGIVLCSFTNMAVRQIAKHFSRDITCCTIHKLLEFKPVYYEIVKEDGTMAKTMRFEPSRNAMNKLPRSHRTIIVDEASMVDTSLINLVIDALPNPEAVQWIFLGDLNQLPPVFGGAVLGLRLMELPVVELTEVYRQALLSPIITLATKIKDGLTIDLTAKLIDDRGEHGKLTIHPWGKSLSADDGLQKAADFCKAAIQQKELDPFKDIILCPFNVSFGVLELNLQIANWLGNQREAIVHEVICGFNTKYLAVGDKVLVQKREAIITGIMPNRSYTGKRAVSATLYAMDRWGGATKRKNLHLTASQEYEAAQGDTDIDAILQSMADTTTVVEDRKAAASHTIVVRFINGGDPATWLPTDTATDNDDESFEELHLDSAAGLNEMLFAYAITVHKSQGSEWRKVFLILHQSHSVMTFRELMYTGITRASKELYIICEPDRGMKTGTLTKASKNPRLKGNTLAEKLASLKEKFDQEAKELQK